MNIETIPSSQTPMRVKVVGNLIMGLACMGIAVFLGMSERKQIPQHNLSSFKSKIICCGQLDRHLQIPPPRKILSPINMRRRLRVHPFRRSVKSSVRSNIKIPTPIRMTSDSDEREDRVVTECYGRVLSLDGFPIPNTNVYIHRYDSETNDFKAYATTIPDDKGSWVIEGLKEGHELKLEVKAYGYFKYVSDPFQVWKGDSLNLGTVSLDPGGAISGTVVDESGAGVANLTVHVFDESHETHRIEMPKTDEAGQFWVSGLTTGSYGLIVRKESINLSSMRKIRVEHGFETGPLIVEVSRETKPKIISSEAERLYAAENAVRWDVEKFRNLEAAKRFVMDVIDSPWWQRFFSKIESIEVKEGGSRRYAYGNRYSGGVDGRYHGYISLPSGWGFNKMVVLHEVAHVVAYKDGHGSKFASVFLELVDVFIGREVANKLDREFARHGVAVANFQEVVFELYPESL